MAGYKGLSCSACITNCKKITPKLQIFEKFYCRRFEGHSVLVSIVTISCRIVLKMFIIRCVLKVGVVVMSYKDHMMSC